MDHTHLEGAAPSALIIELLTWVMARPRTYAETMEAWRTSCPRMPVWEDSMSRGLVEVWTSDDAGASGAAVRITESGRAYLASGA
jgi:hypothetical protein